MIRTQLNAAPTRTVFLLALAAVMIASYLAVWLLVPLYPDEVAFALANGRLPADGLRRFGFHNLCFSNARHIHWMLIGAAHTFGFIYKFKDWALVRLVPFMSIGAFVAAVMLNLNIKARNGWETLLLCSGFIGAAGSGLLLSRGEHVLFLHAASCLLLYWYSKRETTSPALTLLVPAVGAYVCSLSLFVHIQGLGLLPGTALLSLKILLRHKPRFSALIALSVAAFFGLMGMQAYQDNAFHCREDAAFEAGVSELSLGGLIAHDKPVLPVIGQRVENYFNDFLFTSHLSSHVMPDLQDAGYNIAAAAINFPALLLAAGNMIAIIALLACAVKPLMRSIKQLATQGVTMARIIDLLTLDRALAAYAALLWLFIFFDDAAGNFYRNYCLNLLAAGLVTVAASKIVSTREKLLARGIGVIAFCTCAAGMIAADSYITPVLQEGYGGPSISLLTDWRQVAGQVVALKTSCKIDDSAANIAMDDMTYDALRKHKHLMPITYFWYRDMLVAPHTPRPEDTQAARLATLQQTVSSIIARCEAFTNLGIPVQHKEGALCCSKFKE